MKDWKKRLRKWNETMNPKQSKEELEQQIKDLQEEIDKAIENKECINRFRELVKLKILCQLELHKGEAMRDIL